MAEDENRNEHEVSLQFVDAKEEAVPIAESTTVEADVSVENQLSAQIRELEGNLSAMRFERQSLNIKKTELESQVETHATEAQHLRDENLKLSTRILELEDMSMSQSSELVSLHVRNSYLEQRMECIRNEASTMQQKLQIQNTESQQQIEKKTKQVSENLIQIQILREELTQEKRTAEEKQAKIRDLELGRDNLLNQTNDLQQQMRSKDHEIIQLRDEKEELHARIYELEGIVSARDKELEKKVQDSPKISKITKPMSGEKLQSARSLISENISKFNKISDQAKVFKADVSDRIHTSRSLISMNISKFNRNADEPTMNFKGGQAAQRKMDDLAAEFRKNVEDKIRLLSQRIRVLEQLHAENSSSHKMIQETLEQENKVLIAKMSCYEAELSKLKELYEAAKGSMKGLELMLSKLEVGSKDLERVANLLKELELAKNWIQLKSESIRLLGYSLECQSKKVEEKQESMGKMEAKVSHLERKVQEREEELVHLGEEKREVIRQLFVLIDHLREENQLLKQIIIHLKRSQSKRH